MRARLLTKDRCIEENIGAKNVPTTIKKRIVPVLSAPSMLPEARSKQKKRYRDSTIEVVVMMKLSKGLQKGWHLTLRIVHPMETIVPTAIFRKVLPLEMSGTIAIRKSLRTCRT